MRQRGNGIEETLPGDPVVDSTDPMWEGIPRLTQSGNMDFTETERLLHMYREAEASLRKASAAAVEAQKTADDAAAESGRCHKALEEHFETLKATMRIEARDA